MIACIGIHEAKEDMIGGRVYKAINLREWITVLRTCFVAIRKIGAHSPFAVGFFDKTHWIANLSIGIPL